jgi:hypothetical protein
MKTNITQEKLTQMWKIYINDSSLFTKQPFGQYVHSEVMAKGYCWPRLYYSGHKAWDILHAHIHHGDEEGIRKVQ